MNRFGIKLNINDNCYRCGYQKSNYIIIKNGVTERYCLRCINAIKGNLGYQAS